MHEALADRDLRRTIYVGAVLCIMTAAPRAAVVIVVVVVAAADENESGGCQHLRPLITLAVLIRAAIARGLKCSLAMQ